MAINLLQMKPMLRGSGSISEISSTSGKGSIFGDTQDELHDLVTLLGLNSIDDLYQERFRIDRKKLECMIMGNEDMPAFAEQFFQKIMEETKTRIAWPCKLKIGAKSKKDPHVRVAGRPHDVANAKQKILSYLEIKSSRVTLKIDVSYTDHSHIIGKGGKSIKQVMDETQCHIHFPDSNRSNPIEKSNQVSIAGDIRGVERARAGVRNLTPLIFSFEMPIVSCQQNVPDANSPFIAHISQQYNVHVMFRSQPKLHATLVMVKGSEWEVQKVKEATMLLINYICESISNQILVQMSMEISPIHHPIVRGKGSMHIKQIMQKTGTQIMFPEVTDPNIAPIKKSNITITGRINNVYIARQQLMGSLPLVLMFDLPDNTDFRAERISNIMANLDVFIHIRQKPKHSTFGVVIKGIERNASNIYEARRQLLNLDEPRVVAQIPPTYFFPDAPVSFTADYNANHNNSNNPSQSSSALSQSSNYHSWNSSASATSPIPSLQLSQYSLFPNSFCSQQEAAQSNTSNPLNAILTNNNNTSCASTAGASSSISSQFSMNTTFSALLSASTSGNTGTSTSPTCDDRKDPMNSDSGFNSASSSRRQSTSPSPYNNQRGAPVASLPDTSTDLVLSSMLSNISREPLIKPAIQNLPYDQRRLAAWQAMQSPISGYRVPNSSWAGYGFSATSPGAIRFPNQEDGSSLEEDDIWLPPSSNSQQNNGEVPSASGICMDSSNYIDQISLPTLQKLTSGNWQDLSTLLNMFGLDKYVKLFENHEIDLETFPTLTDYDLLEIGVSALGARRKMHLLIAELKKRSNTFCGSVAPGAERKGSSGTNTSESTISPRKVWL